MAEVYKEICLNKQNTDEKIYFTYDILQIQESLEDTWFEFVEKEDKIVLQALNIPILKQCEKLIKDNKKRKKNKNKE